MNVSCVDPAAGPLPEFTTMADQYAEMLRRFRPGVADVMRAICGEG